MLLLGGTGMWTRAAVLPTDLEARIGESYAPADADERNIWHGLARLEEGIRTSPQRLDAPQLDAHIRAVLERLIGRPAPDIRIYVIRDAFPNAAMLPSGMMLVNTGLLARVRDEAQLAAVLAHEAGHYFRRHALDLYREERRRSARVSSGASVLHTFDDSHGAWRFISHAIMMSNSRFSRDLESEADAYGLALMARARYRPRAALAIWEQLLDERRASAAARRKRYRDQTASELSTHPPSQVRMANLADTADHLAVKHSLGDSADEGAWSSIIGSFAGLLLRDQVYLNDPGASLHLLEQRAKRGWTGLLRFYEGEIHRLRGAQGDARAAALAYAAATMLADAPSEAWRAHGYSQLAAGNERDARAAFDRYLEANPHAPDRSMVRYALEHLGTDPATRPASEEAGRMIVSATSGWKKLHRSAQGTLWEETWTWAGPQSDRVAMVDGLPDGKALVIQKRSDDKQVPAFRGDMSAHDLTTMLEVSYRLRGVTVFDIESVEPVEFLGGHGVSLRYRYASGIVIPKRGRCVMRIVGRKLYALKLEGVADSSFEEAAAAFDRLVADARLRR